MYDQDNYEVEGAIWKVVTRMPVPMHVMKTLITVDLLGVFITSLPSVSSVCCQFSQSMLKGAEVNHHCSTVYNAVQGCYLVII